MKRQYYAYIKNHALKVLHRTSRWNGKQSCHVFGKFRIRFSARRLAVFLLLQATAETIRLDKKRSRPAPSKSLQPSSQSYKYYVSGHYPSSCLYFKTHRDSSTDWTQLSRFYLKTEKESSLRDGVF
jgi:hypothetical protein